MTKKWSRGVNTFRTPENITAVREAMSGSTLNYQSLKMPFAYLVISDTYVEEFSIRKERYNFHPYKLQIVQV